MTAKEQALKDIKDELKREHKAFIAFKSELNPIMRKLVSEQIKEQKKISKKTSYCLSMWRVE